MKRRFTIGTTMLAACLLTIATVGARKAPTTMADQLEFGVQMAKRGLWSEALFRFKQAARMSPDNPKILNNMAVAYEALGNFEKALDYYQRAIKADPGNRELKRNYSRFVEFYRAFKPAPKEDGEGEQARASPAPVAAPPPGG